MFKDFRDAVLGGKNPTGPLAQRYPWGTLSSIRPFLPRFLCFCATLVACLNHSRAAFFLSIGGNSHALSAEDGFGGTARRTNLRA